MKSQLITVALGMTLGMVLIVAPAFAEDDPRVEVALPASAADAFLAEMRTHMGNLDDIVVALAEGDFNVAADIAELRMTMGHQRWQAMAKQGISMEEITAMRQRHKKMRSAQGPQGRGRMGYVFGRFMPDDFRAMGAMFHEAAEDFARMARNVATPPRVADYQAISGALGAITTACRACHDAFRITGVGGAPK